MIVSNIPVDNLFASLSLWPDAQRNYDALASVKVRDLGVATLMFNPARVRSTAAKIDAAAVARRPCFLCRANRPALQSAISWRTYEVLVNPFPIFPHHLTIASSTHEPQALSPRVTDLFTLARQLPHYAVFFNGAKCGASAPDHAHFQAAKELSSSPVLHAVLSDNGKVIASSDDGSIVASTASGRLAYRISSPNEDAAARLFTLLMGSRQIDEEMLNAAALLRPDGTAVDIVIIPRRRFRPWQFDADPADQIMVSPAAVEVLGFLILPRLDDFNKMTPDVASDIISQVCFASDDELNPNAQ